MSQRLLTYAVKHQTMNLTEPSRYALNGLKASKQQVLLTQASKQQEQLTQPAVAQAGGAC